MSANTVSSEVLENGDKTFTFKQPIPLPSYLVAIVAGNIVEKEVGKRSAVVSEPDIIDFAHKELEDLEKYLTTIEEYIGKYQWNVR